MRLRDLFHPSCSVFSAALCAIASADAQSVSWSARSLTPLSVEARAEPALDRESYAALQTLPSPLLRQASAREDGRSAFSNAVFFANNTLARVVSGASVRRTGSLRVTQAKSRGSVEFRVRASRPTAGFLSITIQCSAVGDTLFWTYANVTVDVQSRSYSLRAQVHAAPRRTLQVQIPYTISSVGVPVRVRYEVQAGTARTHGSANVDVDLRFLPNPCTATRYGTSCGDLFGSFPSPGELRFDVRSGLPNATGWIYLGTRPMREATDFPGCFWLTAFDSVLHGFRTNSSGRARHTIPIPSPYDAYFQAIVTNADWSRVIWTNGLRVRCNP